MVETVKAYGYEWEVLDRNFSTKDGEGILCLMKEPLRKMAFSESNDADYEGSDVRRYLEGEFSEELREKGASILCFSRDLMASDGTGKGRSVDCDGAYLLTEGMYKKYHPEKIGKKKEWWWLATAYSFSSGTSNYVRLVSTDGSLNYSNACRGRSGVSPACVFSFLPDQDTEKNEIAEIREELKRIAERLDEIEKRRGGEG